jgi:hypothetical protein
LLPSLGGGGGLMILLIAMAVATPVATPVTTPVTTVLASVASKVSQLRWDSCDAPAAAGTIRSMRSSFMPMTPVLPVNLASLIRQAGSERSECRRVKAGSGSGYYKRLSPTTKS